MRRTLLPTSAFDRALRRLIRNNRVAAHAINSALEKLAADAFDPRLKTHKLKGDLASRWAASAAYDLRIIFRFVKHAGSDAILLLSVGSHNDVY